MGCNCDLTDGEGCGNERKMDLLEAMIRQDLATYRADILWKKEPYPTETILEKYLRVLGTG